MREGSTAKNVSTEDETPQADDFGKGVFDETPQNQDEFEAGTTPTDDHTDIANDPSLVDFFKKAQKDNVAVANAEPADEPEDEPVDEPEEDEVVAEVGDETIEEEDYSGIPEPEETGAPAWSQSDRRLAGKYGLTDADLAKMPNVEALHTTLDILERQVATGTDARETTDEPEQAASEPSNVEAILKAVGELPEVKLEDFPLDEYRDEDKKLVETVVAQSEAIKKLQRVLTDANGPMNAAAQMEQQQIAAQQEQARATFNATLDKYPAVYGKMKDGKVGEAYAAAREQVREQAEIIFAGYQANPDREMPTLEQVIQQAVGAAHGDRIHKRSPSTRQEVKSGSVKKQSNMRRSPGNKAAAVKKTPLPDSDDPAVIAAHPELVEFFDNAQIENGAV